MRVAGYIRVSTDEQAENGQSIIEQPERLKAFCRAMGWPDPVLFTDDGYSAKDLNRPDIQKLIKRIEKNEFDIVITTKLDRLSRNLLDLLQFVKNLDAHDCGYVSATESFNTSTAAGRLVLQLLGTFAEFERERISERVKDNLMSLAKNTDKALTIPCFGYDIIDEKYSINEKEAESIRLMFELAEQGQGYRAIVKALNDAGSKTKGSKKRHSVPWTQVSVTRLMHTETIRGIMVYNKRGSKNGKRFIRDKSEWIVKKNNHPAIISEEKYEIVKKILDSRKNTNKHGDSETYLLTSIVKCAHCKGSMIGNTARIVRGAKKYEYFRYVCQTYQKASNCFYHAVHRDDLELKIINAIESVASCSPEQIQKMKIAETVRNFEEIEELKRQLKKINKKIQKQIEAYEEDLITAQDLKVASVRAEKERSEIAAEIERLEDNKSSEIDVQRNAKRLMGDIKSFDRVVSKSAMRQIISSVEITNGSELAITWIPFV